ncbi:MAG: prepilin-type N-terminal cleavage/methylation domain-containing protein [Rhodocyclaceae bacterium]|jgi:prepilin-type N-terminal cleavage/methylation domain-containing protein|nr:prepilin-type N-terminal cleavage/methylation domain-containing protein [Rhodocyclaceae bacterium]
MKKRGFSLVEFMVVVAIAGIVLAVAVPALQSAITGARTRSVAESIYSGLLMARSEAIKRNAPMRFQLVSTAPASSGCGTGGTAYAASTNAQTWVVTQYTSSASRGIAAGKCVSKAYTPEDQEEPCRVSVPVSAVEANGWYDRSAFTPSTPPGAAACLQSDAIPTSQRVNCRPMGNPAACADDPLIAFSSAATEAVSNVTIASSGAMSGAFVVTFGAVGQLLANNEGAVPSGSIPYSLSISGTSGRSWRVQVKSNGAIKLCDPAATAASGMGCS